MRTDPSDPHRPHSNIPEHTLGRIAAVRLQRWIGKRIAAELGILASNVSHHLRLLKLSGMKDFEPRPTILRCELKTSGEVIHMGIKVLRCFVKSGHRLTGAAHRNGPHPGSEMGASACRH